MISQNRENELKILALQQELKNKTIEYQNSQKYLNDVQNDRKEKIKQYEQDIEAAKSEWQRELMENNDKSEKRLKGVTSSKLIIKNIFK